MGRKGPEVANCGHGPQEARGLCQGCYDWARRHGYLTQHELGTNPIKDIIAEIEFGAVRTLEDAHKFGIKPASLERALLRARRAGIYSGPQLPRR